MMPIERGGDRADREFRCNPPVEIGCGHWEGTGVVGRESAESTTVDLQVQNGGGQGVASPPDFVEREPWREPE